MDTQPDVIRNRAKHIVSVIGVENSSESVLEVVSAARLQRHSVDVKPRTPEGTPKEVYVAIDEPTCIVPEAYVYLRLDVEVNDTEHTTGS